MKKAIRLKNDPFESKLADLREELQGLMHFPNSEFISIIKELGFKCELCARCCTKEFNDHVFLLDSDLGVIRKINPDAITPAPNPEFCDQNGRFYVSGYALKANSDGSCIFLNTIFEECNEEGSKMPIIRENKRCNIYESRPLICRVYPHMLHREVDESDKVDWRMISGLNEHGSYHFELEESDCRTIARETRAYEEAYLRQMIGFHEAVQAHFIKNGLKHVQRTYDRRMREFLKRDSELEIFVYSGNGFEKCNLKP